MAPNSQPATAVVIPVKDFRRAKERLASELSPPERATLRRRMASRVVAAAAPLPVWVVCDDDAVAAWARDHGAAVSWQPRSGLNGAVQAAYAERSDEGFGRVIVAHADLPRATSLSWLTEAPEIDDPRTAVVVPDRHGDGTNVLSLPGGTDFRFAYGPGSCARHLAEAERCRLAVHLRPHNDLQYDVDDPADLAFVPPLA